MTLSANAREQFLSSELDEPEMHPKWRWRPFRRAGSKTQLQKLRLSMDVDHGSDIAGF